MRINRKKHLKFAISRPDPSLALGARNFPGRPGLLQEEENQREENDGDRQVAKHGNERT